MKIWNNIYNIRTFTYIYIYYIYIYGGKLCVCEEWKGRGIRVESITPNFEATLSGNYQEEVIYFPAKWFQVMYELTDK